ncbi:MAG: hypothetical protein V1820_05615 [archaeon]
MTPFQRNPPKSPDLTELKKVVSSEIPQTKPPQLKKPPEELAEFVLRRDKIEAKSLLPEKGPDTSEFSAKVILLGNLVQEISLDSQMKRKDELENALFVLEKEHLNGLASDSSYFDIKARIIKELKKLDEKLALISAYSEKNKNFKSTVAEIEELVEPLVQAAKKTEETDKVEGTLSEITKKYLAGELGEENYYDLKAKLAVKLSSV